MADDSEIEIDRSGYMREFCGAAPEEEFPKQGLTYFGPLKPDVLDKLKDRCCRYANGECNNWDCLARGGWEPFTEKLLPTKERSDKYATCPDHELIQFVEQSSQREEEDVKKAEQKALYILVSGLTRLYEGGRLSRGEYNQILYGSEDPNQIRRTSNGGIQR